MCDPISNSDHFLYHMVFYSLWGWLLLSDLCSTWNRHFCPPLPANRPTRKAGSLPHDLYLLIVSGSSGDHQSNSLSGTFPSLANLSSLQEVYLDTNNFTSIPAGCFTGLSSLQILSMSQNINLNSWVFPSELTKASSLITFAAGAVLFKIKEEEICIHIIRAEHPIHTNEGKVDLCGSVDLPVSAPSAEIKKKKRTRVRQRMKQRDKLTKSLPRKNTKEVYFAPSDYERI